MEYYNEDLLYKYFKETIKNDSLKKMERIRKEIDAIKERELKRIDLEVKRQIDWTIGLELADIKKEHQTKVNQITIENDVKLMAHREEILKSIFADVEAKLKKFVTTKEYEKFILSKVNAIYKEYGSKCQSITIGEKDNKLSKAILENIKKINITYSKDVKIGGFVMCLAGGMEIDEMLDSKLIDKIDDFITKSRLFIK